jgi:long-chain acyl-CoA synthetase
MNKKHILHEKREFENVRALIEWAGDFYADRTAYSFRVNPHDKEITKKSFKEFRDDVRALATELYSMGCAGKNCVLIGKSSYEWVTTYYATLSIGAILVPLDREWGKEELLETAKRADISFLICDSDIEEKAQFIAENTELSAPYVLLGADGDNSLKALSEAGRVKFLESSDAYFKAEIDPYKLALLVFTSGTTGKGKGVMLCQNNFLSDLSDVIPYMDFSNKTVGVLPPHHTYGSSVMFIGHAIIGSEIYLSSGLRYVQKELKEQKPGHLCLVPLYLETFYRKIQANIKEKGKEKLVRKMIKVSNALRKVGIDLRKKFFGEIRAAFGGEVTMIISGGAPINPEILSFFEAIGISTLNGYGITECAPIVAVNRTKNVVPGSVGNILDIDTVKIDEPNEDGEGEICVKGSNVMLGYYKDESATADAMTEDGYFRTGDYGRINKKKQLLITGRKKNLIITGNGKNIYPEEIEDYIGGIPYVLENIVYGLRDESGAEDSLAVQCVVDPEVLKKTGKEELQAKLKSDIFKALEALPTYKQVTTVIIREEPFVKTTTNKIRRAKDGSPM